MTKRHLPTLALALLLLAAGSLASHAQRKEIHILSANDMHAAIEAFPALADIADSLRTLYPGLLVFSAGDNRTGEPLNDMYDIPAYPMVALMNQVGFDATTLGNHEFDSGGRGLARLIGLSNFSYICANVHPDDSLGMPLRPTQVFDVEGTRVGVIGVVELGTRGIPDSHPDNVRGISFSSPSEAVEKYKGLRDQCDVLILLTHLGYEADVELSAATPWADLIIGGHSHTQLDGGEMHNGLLITQNTNRLKRVTHTTIVVENGKVVEKRAENIDVQRHTGRNKVVDNMLAFFSNNPSFRRVLTHVATPFEREAELGYMMCDAFMAETGSDVGIQNAGGVRYGQHGVGDFTVSDVLRLDPFGNDAVVMEITGQELRQMLLSSCGNDGYGFPFVGGITCQIVRDKKDPSRVKDLKLFNPDGSKFDLKRRYKVATSSYVASIADAPRQDQGHSINRKTADLVIDFLDSQESVSYQGENRITIVTK